MKTVFIKTQRIVDDFEYWQAMAKRLDDLMLADDITMQEIVDELKQ